MIEVVKAGMADSVQDAGRFGYQHLGINPTGAMDLNAMRIANALVGNQLNQAVVELIFPASSFCFHRSALIALSGADFSAKLNRKSIPINQPVLAPAKSELKFSRILNGSVGYLAVQGGFELIPWLNSYSTNLKATTGGVEGRYLKKGDKLELRNKGVIKIEQPQVLPWRADVSDFYSSTNTIRCLKGNEFDWLTKKSQSDFQKKEFVINVQSDRMGYRLKGIALGQNKKRELLSTAVTFGTIQLLPNGELIILMADHQTTGGYPRIGHVITADRSVLVQYRPNEKLSFQFVSLEEAEALAIAQSKSRAQLQVSCRLKLRELNQLP